MTLLHSLVSCASSAHRLTETNLFNGASDLSSTQPQTGWCIRTTSVFARVDATKCESRSICASVRWPNALPIRPGSGALELTITVSMLDAVSACATAWPRPIPIHSRHASSGRRAGKGSGSPPQCGAAETKKLPETRQCLCWRTHAFWTPSVGALRFSVSPEAPRLSMRLSPPLYRTAAETR
jgi:hypothetical protein